LVQVFSKSVEWLQRYLRITKLGEFDYFYIFHEIFMLLDRAALKSYRNEILMLITPYLAEISLVLYYDILQNMLYFRQMNSNRATQSVAYAPQPVCSACQEKYPRELSVTPVGYFTGAIKKLFCMAKIRYFRATGVIFPRLALL
jgi:hypothetical protein